MAKQYSGEESKKGQVKSEEELVSIFLEQSVNIYVKNTQKEGVKGYGNDELIADTTLQLYGLIDLLHLATRELDKDRVHLVMSSLHSNLDSYVKSMDKKLTEDRDKFLQSRGNDNPDSNALKAAMEEVAKKSDFIKVAEKLKKEDAAIKETGWKQLADFFEVLRLPELVKVCKKMNEESKQVSLAKSVDKTLKSFTERTANPADLGGGRSK